MKEPTGSAWPYSTVELAASDTVGMPVPAPRPRIKTMKLPGKPLSEQQEDRCYAFVRQSAGGTITGRQLEALTVLWAVMRELVSGPPDPGGTDRDTIIDGVPLTTVLTAAIPSASDEVRASLRHTIVDSCTALATAPPAPRERIARLHALWLKIHCAACRPSATAALSNDDYLLLGRVAGVLNPDLGGLSDACLPHADTTAERDRVDVMVANIALVSFNMLQADEAVRRVVIGYLHGSSVSCITDRSRAEVARYGASLEAEPAHPSYEYTGHVSRPAYTRSLRRVMGDPPAGGPGARGAFATWRAVVADAVANLPTDFNGGQAAISVDIILAVRDAVQARQPAPVWGDDANWGVGIAFAVSTTGFGVTLEKFHAYCGLMAYYVSIEKARDAVQGAWQNLLPLSEPGAQLWQQMTAGWPEPVVLEMQKVHAEVSRMRGSTRMRHWDKASSPAPADHGTPTPGPTYKPYCQNRVHDGVWTAVEVFGAGETGGPAHLLEEPHFWACSEAGICGYEAVTSQRRKYEDTGSGLKNHLLGPAAGRLTWLCERALALYHCLGSALETGTCRTPANSLTGTFWYWSLAFPGTPTWNNLTPTPPS